MCTIPWRNAPNASYWGTKAGKFCLASARSRWATRFFRNAEQAVSSKMKAMQFSEAVSSFPCDQWSANPAAAGGSAQPPARNGNATPKSAAKPDQLRLGVVEGGRGGATDDLTVAPASSFSGFNDWIEQGMAPKTWQITEPLREQPAIYQILSR